MQIEGFGILLLACCVALTHSYKSPVYSGLPMSVWRSINPSRTNPQYAGEDSETYGYVDRYPPVERQNPRYAFGVAHRFADTKADQAGDYDAYPDTPYLGLSGFAKRSKSYEDHWEPWVYDDNDNSDEYQNQNGYYQSGPDPQDVVNFERYLQKYFDQPAANYDDEEWNNAKEEEEPEEAAYEQFRNDEDAASQLHSLISPRRPTLSKVLGLDRLLPPQKKSQIIESTTKAATEKPPTTTTVQAPTAKPAGKGQKEEALLRPPSSARTLASAEATQQPSLDNDQKTIYDTIKKLFDMHSKLEDVPEDITGLEGSRMKRFVSQDDFFTHTGQRSFGKNKIKA